MRSPEKLFNDFFQKGSVAEGIKYDIKLVIEYAQKEAYDKGINDIVSQLCKLGTHFNIVDADNIREKLISQYPIK